MPTRPPVRSAADGSNHRFIQVCLTEICGPDACQLRFCCRRRSELKEGCISGPQECPRVGPCNISKWAVSSMPAGSPFGLPAPVSILLPGLPAVSIPGSRSYPFLARPLGADSVQRHPGAGVGCQPRPLAGAMSPELSRRRRPQSISPDRKTANSVLDHKSRALPVQPAAATSPDSSHLPTFSCYSRRGQSLGVHPEADPFCYSGTH